MWPSLKRADDGRRKVTAPPLGCFQNPELKNPPPAVIPPCLSLVNKRVTSGLLLDGSSVRRRPEIG
jgi:hypothetical protein